MFGTIANNFDDVKNTSNTYGIHEQQAATEELTMVWGAIISVLEYINSHYKNSISLTMNSEMEESHLV